MESVKCNQRTDACARHTRAERLRSERGGHLPPKPPIYQTSRRRSMHGPGRAGEMQSMREPENGDWLRRVMDIAVVMGSADGACPLFRAASLGHVETFSCSWTRKSSGGEPRQAVSPKSCDFGYGRLCISPAGAGQITCTTLRPTLTSTEPSSSENRIIRPLSPPISSAINGMPLLRSCSRTA